ncbi:MAG TPA: hypothetical protein VNQ76_21545, partial [Planctomicrobium sp.]|nr:hypothetical protein [Planctomicrobium sp.]
HGKPDFSCGSAGALAIPTLRAQTLNDNGYLFWNTLALIGRRTLITAAAQVLGYSNPAMTLSVYAHVMPTNQLAVTQAMSQL